MPQSAYSLRSSTGKKYWFAGANFNYYADIYLDPNPDRRTEEAIAGYVDTDPQVNEVLDQTKLDNGYSVSMFAGKSFKISNYFLNVNVNISNLTNNQSFVTGELNGCVTILKTLENSAKIGPYVRAKLFCNGNIALLILRS